jgi:hypothetical protein
VRRNSRGFRLPQMVHPSFAGRRRAARSVDTSVSTVAGLPQYLRKAVLGGLQCCAGYAGDDSRPIFEPTGLQPRWNLRETLQFCTRRLDVPATFEDPLSGVAAAEGRRCCPATVAAEAHAGGDAGAVAFPVRPSPDRMAVAYQLL